MLAEAVPECQTACLGPIVGSTDKISIYTSVWAN